MYAIHYIGGAINVKKMPKNKQSNTPNKSTTTPSQAPSPKA